MHPEETPSSTEEQWGLKTLPDIHFLTPQIPEEEEAAKSHKDKTYFGYSYRFWCIVALCISVLVSGIVDVIVRHVAGTTIHTTLRAFFYGYVIYSSGSTIKSCLCFSLFWTLGGLWWTGTSVWLFWSFHDMIQRYVILVIDMCVVAALVVHMAMRERCQSRLTRTLPRLRYNRNQDGRSILEREPMATTRLRIGGNLQRDSHSVSHRGRLPTHKLDKQILTKEWVTCHQQDSEPQFTLECVSCHQGEGPTACDLEGDEMCLTMNHSSTQSDEVQNHREENNSTDQCDSGENQQPVSCTAEMREKELTQCHELNV
ncbi:uncharacterized protein LOC135462879 [Liolophura sinensis]|uniref:uncharacterized protein LOC135462879 n=1 Tax=Liolophura sinensis TaxID=3198878 RepID=UPI00315934F3